MANFYCSECKFSKTVKDEMAGKKARCPKCNAVNVVLELGVEPPEDAIRDGAAKTKPEPAKQAAPAPAEPAPAKPEAQPEPAPAVASTASEAPEVAPIPPSQSRKSDTAEQITIPVFWKMCFAASLVPIVLGIVLLTLQVIGLAMICFGVGMVAFIGLAGYYSFT